MNVAVERSSCLCSGMKENYAIPTIEKVEFFKKCVIVTSQLENAGSINNWENVGKPTWGQGNGGW